MGILVGFDSPTITFDGCTPGGPERGLICSLVGAPVEGATAEGIGRGMDGGSVAITMSWVGA